MQAAFEKILLDPAESFRCVSFTAEHFPVPLHFHPEYELSLVVRGSGTRFVGDRISHFDPGDLVLVGPNVPHCWVDTDTPGAGEVEQITIQFKQDFLGTGFFDAAELAPIKSMLELAARGVEFQGERRARAMERMKALPKLTGIARIAELLGVFGDLAEADALPLSSPSYSPQPASGETARIDRVYRYLFDNFTSEIHLTDVARTAHMTRTAFCRFFKRHSGKTVSWVLNDIRIGHACKLLRGNDVTVSEACFKSGFNNVSHFHRQFVRRVGCTPTEYKKRFAATAQWR